MNIENMLDKDFSGVISVVKNGEKLFQKAFGYADRANKVANEIDTKFGTASAGKVFVATAILKLIKEKKLSFDTCIGDVLQFDLKQIDPQITIAQLLNHTSGIPDYFDESIMEEYEDLWINIPNYRIRKSADLIPLFIDKPMLYPRGEKFQYNNTGFVVLGLIIEEISALPFDEYIHQVIFEPCKMESTGYYELDKLPEKCASAYIYNEESKDYRTNIFSIDAKGTGAGGAFTTAQDVETFWKYLLAGKIINVELLDLMLAPQVEEKCYGYGVWILKNGNPSFQGSDPGVDFITSYDLKRKMCITILTNMNVNVDKLYNEIYDSFT